MAVDNWLESSSLLEKPHPLASTGDSLAASHLFLAEQVSIIRSTLQGKAVSEDAGDDSELALAKAALLIILEILAASLGNDRSQYLSLARTKLGKDSNLLSDVSHDLGTMVDALLKANHGLKARDMTMSETEQRWITTLVRLLGNLSYRCRSNQDALRLLQIPLEGATEERTALHVLLSCTSLAPGCFTLREWAIVALRNVLEGNEENQALVEKLEAQQPMQSTELERMGLRVDMDRHGKVKIVQKPEEKKEASAESSP
jgi:ataxin-10